jgi:hemolysin activation/secretion protein
VRVKLETDFADDNKAISQINLTFSHGIKGLGSTDNDNLLASRAFGRVDFSKIEVLATRLQPLWGPFSFLGAAYAQYAFTPLLSSELCGYGGRFIGRAYDPSQLVGDSCFLALGELRADMPIGGKEISLAQAYAFIDRGRLYNTPGNHNIAAVPGTFEGVDGASIGGGIRLGWYSLYTADLSFAKAIDGPRQDQRVFFILTGRY